MGIPTYGEGGGQAGWAKFPTLGKNSFWRLPLSGLVELGTMMGLHWVQTLEAIMPVGNLAHRCSWWQQAPSHLPWRWEWWKLKKISFRLRSLSVNGNSYVESQQYHCFPEWTARITWPEENGWIKRPPEIYVDLLPAKPSQLVQELEMGLFVN